MVHKANSRKPLNSSKNGYILVRRGGYEETCYVIIKGDQWMPHGRIRHRCRKLNGFLYHNAASPFSVVTQTFFLMNMRALQGDRCPVGASAFSPFVPVTIHCNSHATQSKLQKVTGLELKRPYFCSSWGFCIKHCNKRKKSRRPVGKVPSTCLLYTSPSPRDS